MSEPIITHPNAQHTRCDCGVILRWWGSDVKRCGCGRRYVKRWTPEMKRRLSRLSGPGAQQG